MTQSLSERLRAYAKSPNVNGIRTLHDQDCIEAADEIDRLNAEIARKDAALEAAIPFIGYQATVPEIIEQCRAALRPAKGDGE